MILWSLKMYRLNCNKTKNYEYKIDIICYFSSYLLNLGI